MLKLSNVIVGFCLCTAAFSALAAPADNGITMDTVILGALDKVTARVNTLKSPVGLPVKFGTLEIVAQTCVTTPPEDPPESAAFLQIFQIQEDKEEQQVFGGWMFASSPALSAMDHPVYDVWVLGCEDSTRSKSD